MLNLEITKQLPNFKLDIKLKVNNNIIVLFGPSGCGKTTTLRCISGLAKPDTGIIKLNDTIWYSSSQKAFTPPYLRNVGYMFQDYALFPHMSVKDNIWYGVKDKASDTSILYEKLLDILKISHLVDRFPSKLSGGEKQRVALARALMTKPNILLLDEPLSALDSTTRSELHLELKEIQRLWKIPFVLVTHDQDEAKFLGDEIVFLDHGKQISPPINWHIA